MMDFSGSPTYEQARSQLIVQVVDAKRNQEMLSRVPHTRMEDLALFYCIQSEDGRSAALVTNELIKAFGISKEQLHEDALANAAVLRPATFRNIAEVLTGFLDAPPDVMAEMASPLYVVSNTESVLGASAIF